MIQKVLVVVGLLSFGFSASAGAQAHSMDSGGAMTPDQMLNELLKPSTQTASPTTRPQFDSLRQNQILQPQGHADAGVGNRLLREGSDVVGRSGRLVQKPDNLYAQIVFDNRHGEPALEPMNILPDLKLMQMENATTATRRELHFNVSGLITEYHGSNFVLLDSGTEDMSQAFIPPPPRKATTGPASAEQMLNDMLSADTRPAEHPEARPRPETDATSGSGSLAPGAPSLTVLREQSQLIDRTARLTPSADGRRRELTLESDGTTLQDPPLIVLPNLKLSAMENAQTGASKDIRFRVTGMVTEYRGRNYILLEKVLVIPEVAGQF